MRLLFIVLILFLSLAGDRLKQGEYIHAITDSRPAHLPDHLNGYHASDGTSGMQGSTNASTDGRAGQGGCGATEQKSRLS